MKKENTKKGFGRRDFFKMLTVGGIGAAMLPTASRLGFASTPKSSEKPKTNVDEALAYPRVESSMPGKYPAKVVKVVDETSYTDRKVNKDAAYKMIAEGMVALTGAATLSEAWLQFVQPGERIGLKLNPIGGTLLSTSHEVVESVIEQLKEAGISFNDIIIWDRREFQLHEAGFTPERYPGIKIAGTECKDAEGSFYDSEGKLYSESRIDKDWYYWAEAEMEYDAYTLPYMVNSGEYSYFTKILTQEVDKVINIPILKNAGATVTLCLKNLGFGVISNTSRLHKDLWNETIAQVCAFPPVRDKVVLNIADGILGCYQGGPGANPQFILPYHTILLGTDAVAVDRVGYDIVIDKRIEKGVQQQDTEAGKTFMRMAKGYGLGESEIEKIDLQTLNLT
ncbi:DUF362 domain-containing protein [Perlabentimonas gracilis]|uniref:DUF362 domain-containing protein n=1 Tax=Perlabentimonas gracilis TaxID=2715279 RepID=UPI00140951F6|nr:DUF362 domain-containing protein [Perlabentimonas gracilis]NHB67060.1 DUF362 domain-containing protein [Perlabentimonas gracilis]